MQVGRRVYLTSAGSWAESTGSIALATTPAEEANLMRKVLPKQQYIIWLKKFMPELFDSKLKIATGKVEIVQNM